MAERARKVMSGSGSAPQLDERRWTIYRDRIGDYVGYWRVENTPGVADAFGREKVEVVPLAASPGGGELDLTDREERAIVHELEAFVIPMFATVGEHITEEGRERRDAINAARSKLRARLDRKDDEQ